MYTNFVKAGDIIRIEKGMHVSTLVPISVFSKEKPFIGEYANTVVEIGATYINNSNSRENILDKFDSFLKSEFNIFLSTEELSNFIDKLPIDCGARIFDTSFLEGKYVVYETHFLTNKIAPYQVFCYKKDNPRIKIMFFQNCPFYEANISKDIEIIGNVNENINRQNG